MRSRVDSSVCGLALLAILIGTGIYPGANASAEGLPKVAPADLSRISLDDFTDADLIVPFYLAHCHRVANSIEGDGPNRGFITLPVWRPEKFNEPYNARVLENYMPLAYFYCTDRPWNPYYGDKSLRLRLEALLDFWCSVQSPDGRFSEYKPEGWNLAATGFAVMFMGETLHLLHGGPPIDEALHQRVIAAFRKASQRLLTDQELFDHAKRYSNQYSNLWGGLLAFLQDHPDPEFRSMLKSRLEASLEWHQSPAGYWYEGGGCDWPYTLRTHAGNILMAWHYARETDLAPLFVLGEKRWAGWLACNAVLEPDGRTFLLNRALETRTPGKYITRHNPLSEMVPLARAFEPTRSEVDQANKAKRAELAANWPNVSALEVGNDHAYSPHPILNLAHGRWYPTETQRIETRKLLPYLARTEFNHQRVDRNKTQTYTFIRRPAYYAAFNAGRNLSRQQRLGLGLLWSKGYGTLLQSQTAAGRAAWGTRAADTKNVYETALRGASWCVAQEDSTLEPGIRDLPQGDVLVTYTLKEGAEKKVTFHKNSIKVQVTHAGPFVEQLPLLLPKDAFPKTDAGVAYMPGTGLKIVYSPEFRTDWHDEKQTIAGKSLVTLTLTGNDTLAYEFQMNNESADQ